MPRPDILVMDQAGWDGAEEADIYPPVPQLAIEIFSPANSKKAFGRKIEIYLNNGALAVWVLQPDSKLIAVHTSEGRLQGRESDSVSFPPSLPPVLVPVAKIFAPRRASKKS
jgi:Uma2 family endonuclease